MKIIDHEECERLLRNNDPGIRSVDGMRWKRGMEAFAMSTYLTSLTLTACSVDLSVISRSRSITHLTLRNTSLKNISPLKDNFVIRHLDVSYNLIEDLSPLETNTTLLTIKAINNLITSIEFLRHNIAIVSIILNNNFIRDVSPLIQNKTVETVHLANNPIRDVSSLRSNTTLTEVYAPDSLGKKEVYSVARYNRMNEHLRNITLRHMSLYIEGELELD